MYADYSIYVVKKKEIDDKKYEKYSKVQKNM